MAILPVLEIKMKLESPSRFTSFYESFSDLIFATMAIFVLLMTIFLVLVKTEQTVPVKSLELVVAVDVTGSMSEPLTDLADTLVTMSKVLPLVSPKFSVGIVAYRLQSNSNSVYRVLDPLPIAAQDEDGGGSFNKLVEFSNRELKAIGGAALLVPSIERAITMFPTLPNKDANQVLVLIGDVGPFENTAGTLRERENTIFQMAKQWAGESPRRFIVPIFTPTSLARERRPQSRKFFEGLAAAVEQPENFTDNSGNMLSILLKFVVKKD